MRWQWTNRFDQKARRLADRHYSRRSPGARQFAPHGRCVVLRTPAADAVWVTSWQWPTSHVMHAWPGAWTCACFRNESPHVSSELIREAVAATRALWPEVPAPGMVTFVDPSKVRHKRDPGRCFRKAGFRPAGATANGLVALQLFPEDMPPAEKPLGLLLASV